MKWISGGLLFLLILTGIAFKLEQRAHGKAKQRIVELTELRVRDRANYESAQREAAEKNKAQVEKIEQRQEAKTNEVVSDYRRQLADLRLRSQARAHQGAPGGPGVSGVPKAAPGVDADGLPDAPCDHLCAQEIELRLMHLQNWVERQATPD